MVLSDGSVVVLTLMVPLVVLVIMKVVAVIILVPLVVLVIMLIVMVPLGTNSDGDPNGIVSGNGENGSSNDGEYGVDFIFGCGWWRYLVQLTGMIFYKNNTKVTSQITG